jgi:hypothetical protein
VRRDGHTWWYVEYEHVEGYTAAEDLSITGDRTEGGAVSSEAGSPTTQSPDFFDFFF